MERFLNAESFLRTGSRRARHSMCLLLPFFGPVQPTGHAVSSSKRARSVGVKRVSVVVLSF
jgi:hypothetical protein